MTGDFSLLIFVLLPFAGALLAWAAERIKTESDKAPKTAPAAVRLSDPGMLTALITAGLVLAGLLAVFLPVFLSGQIRGAGLSFSWDGFCALGMHLCMDGFRALYCLVAAFMWTMSILFSMEYMKGEHNRGRYLFFTLTTLGSTLGVFLSADLYTAFIFFEIMSFTSYTWVAQEETEDALRAAGTYLAVAVIGGLVMLMGLFLLYAQLGTLEIDGLYDAARRAVGGEAVFGAAFSEAWQNPSYRLLFIGAACVLFGYGAKAGVFPLHIWLPKAHPVAPAPASALLSGILTKAGIFGVLVISCQLLFGDGAWGTLILFLGVLTMFIGALLALFSMNLKRTLACSSVSQIGFILVGIGMQGLLGGEGAAAIRGSLLHMVNHSLIKLVLFMAAGVVFMNLHELDLNKIRGFGRGKRCLQFCFLMGALGIGGVPLWNGYISKTLLHESIVEYRHLLAEGAVTSLSVLTGGPAMAAVEWVFLISGGMTVAYMLKLYLCLFVEKNTDAALQARYDGMKRYMNRASCAALMAGALLLPALGLFPHGVTERLADMSSVFLHAQVPEEKVAYFSLANLKGAGISLAIGLLLYLTVVRRWMGKRETAGVVYVDRWPAWLDLENLVYRPLLLTVLPVICGTVCRICDRLMDSLIVLLRKTVYRDSKIPHELREGNQLTHFLGSIPDAVTGYFNPPDATAREQEEDDWLRQNLEGKYEHRLAMTYDDLMENSTIIGRSLSFGLFLACLGLLLTLVYMLI